MSESEPVSAVAEDVLTLLLHAPSEPGPVVGPEVLEVHHVWGNLLVDTCHLPLDAAVTVGDAVGWEWSVLGVPLGWVSAAWAGPLRLTPPLLADVRAHWRTDLHVPSELLPDGRTHTLVREGTEGPCVCLPPGAEAFFDEGEHRWTVDELLGVGRAWREGEVVVVPLSEGARVGVGLGAHVFLLRRTTAGTRVPMRRPDGSDAVLGLSFLLCAAAAGLVALLGAATAGPSTVAALELPRPAVTLMFQPSPPEPPPGLRAPTAAAPKAPGPEGRAGVAEGQLARARGAPGPRGASDRTVAMDAGILGQPSALAALEGGFDGGVAAALGSLSGPKGVQQGGGLGQRGDFRGGGGPDHLGTWGPGGPGGDGDAPYGEPTGFSTKRLGTASPGASEPIVEGSLEASLIDAVVKRRLPSIRHCYQRALQSDPGLGGKVVVAFTIARDGTVSAASLAEDGVDDASVRSCLRAVFFTLKFPEPKGGGVVDVRYPFVFSQG